MIVRFGNKGVFLRSIRSMALISSTVLDPLNSLGNLASLYIFGRTLLYLESDGILPLTSCTVRLVLHRISEVGCLSVAASIPPH